MISVQLQDKIYSHLTSGRALFQNTFWLIGAIFLSLPSPAWATNQIIRPYQSARSDGMGGLRITTGLYDDNFFSNPARITANPQSKFTIIDIMPADITLPTISTISSILSGTNATTAIQNTIGKNLHERFQLIFPAYYHAAVGERKFAWAFAIVAGAQLDALMGQNYQLSFGGITDLMPVFTIGRKLLKDDALSIGLNARFNFRMGSQSSYTLANFIQGSSLPTSALTGMGAMVNGDFGFTYKITHVGAFDFSVAGAVQNVMGGDYNLNLISISGGGSPNPQARSYGLGFSFYRPEWWKLTHTLFAIEVSDVLNNPSGSFFRLLHIGGETRWRSLCFRLGINQGYFTAGLGIDAHYFTLNLATYGEELGLNAGVYEDRRYVLNFGFHI